MATQYEFPKKKEKFPDEDGIWKITQEASILDKIHLDGVSITYWYCPKRWGMPTRTVDDDMVFIVAKGQSKLGEGPKKLNLLKKGDAFHVKRDQLHFGENDGVHSSEIISIHYSAYLFKSLTLGGLINLDGTYSGLKTFLPILTQAVQTFATKPPGWKHEVNAVCYVVLFYLLRNTKNKFHFDTNYKLNKLLRILPAIEYMQKHLSYSITLEQLASTCHLSISQFRKTFNQSMAEPPSRYLNRLRLQHACQLLKTTEDTIETIAEKTGYHEPASLAKAFRKHLGIAPGKYRKSQGL